jgi:hypothetical protein
MRLASYPCLSEQQTIERELFAAKGGPVADLLDFTVEYDVDQASV